MGNGGDISADQPALRRDYPPATGKEPLCPAEPSVGESAQESGGQRPVANACYVDARPAPITPPARAQVGHALFRNSSFKEGQAIVHQQVNGRTGEVVATALIARVIRVDGTAVHLSCSPQSPIFPFLSSGSSTLDGRISGSMSGEVFSRLMKQKGWTIAAPASESIPPVAQAAEPAPAKTKGEAVVYTFKKGDKLTSVNRGGERRTAADIMDVITVDAKGNPLPKPFVRVAFKRDGTGIPDQLKGTTQTFPADGFNALVTRNNLEVEREIYDSERGLSRWQRVEPERAAPRLSAAERFRLEVRALQLAFDPQKREQFALEDHLNELLAERTDVSKEFKAWLASQEDRVAPSLRRLFDEAIRDLSKPHRLLEIERYVNKEELATWKHRLARLDRQIKVTEWALDAVKEGQFINDEVPSETLWDDPLVVRIAFEERHKRPLTPEEDLAIERERMVRANNRGDWEEALLCYASLQARYLSHTDGIQRTAGGRTLTARSNALIHQGAIKAGIPMVVTSDDLEAILKHIDDYNLGVSRRIGDAESMSRGSGALFRGDVIGVGVKVQGEIERLRSTEYDKWRA